MKNRILKNLILIVVPVVACLSSAALAQEDLRARGDRVCRNDARRLCRHVLSQGDMAILQCFQLNRRRLSSGCVRFLREVGQLQ